MKVARSFVLAALLAVTAAGCTAYVDDGYYHQRSYRTAYYTPAYGQNYAYAYSDPAPGYYYYSSPRYTSRWAP